MRGFNPRARLVPKREARAILVSVPWGERVPPLILWLATRSRRLLLAALFSQGTSGSATKTNNSLMKRWMRRQSLPWNAQGSSRKGRQRASNFRSSNLGHRLLGLPGRAVEDLGDSPNAQAQLVDGLQIPLDSPNGQPALFPQGSDQ